MSEKNTPPEEDTLLEFPCEFTVKTMGLSGNDFDAVAFAIVKRHAPDIGEGAVKTKTSKTGKYISVSITLQARSKKQLDAIYQDLTDCKQVLMSL